MHTLLLRELPDDIRTLRTQARRSDGYDKLPLVFTRLGFDDYAQAGDVITADLNALNVTPPNLPRGVVLAKEIVMRTAVTSGKYSELLCLPVGVPVHVSVAAALYAIDGGLADAA